jgi:hypothetical protein
MLTQKIFSASSLPTKCAALACLIFLAAAVTHPADKTTWKRMDSAILRINDEPPKDWNLFREGKKTNALILEVNNRLLLIELHDQQVKELDTASVKRTGDSVTTEAKNPPGKILVITEFVVRDVGSASRIHFEITADSQTVDLELPQWVNRGVTY